MAAVAKIGAAVSPVLVAAVLLLGYEYLRACGLAGPSVEQITTATGASRSRVYELREELRQVLPSLLRPVGRPPRAPSEISPDVAYALRGAAMAFIVTHPGCVSTGPDWHHYGDSFRHYVLELREQHPDVELRALRGGDHGPAGHAEGVARRGRGQRDA